MTGKTLSQASNESARVVGWSPAAARALSQAVDKHGPRSTVAELAGVSRQSLAELLAGNSTPKLGTLRRLTEVLGTDVETILTAEPATLAPVPRSIPVRELDLSYGMGGTFIDELNITTTVRHLPADWIRNFTQAAPEQLFLCRGIGDSMFPTLLDSDVLLVDCSQSSLRLTDRVYVLAMGDVGMVKRVRGERDGGYRLMSDNGSVSDIITMDDEARIIGRVVAIIRKI